MTELGSHLESEMGSDWLFWKSFVSLCLGKLRDEEILPFFFFLPQTSSTRISRNGLCCSQR